MNDTAISGDQNLGPRFLGDRLLFLCIILSGCTGLIYELIWARSLHLVFGVGHYAIATVTAVFLMGLALGSYFLGKASERISNTLIFYAYLELGIAIFSTLSWFGLKNFSFFNEIYYSIYNTQNIVLLTFGRLVLASIILLPPTFLIGGTIPAISKIFLRNENKLGHDFSKIYYINTLGGLIGALLTGFFLIRTVGVGRTFFCAVLVNLVISMVIFIYVKSFKIKILKNKKVLTELTKPRLLIALFLVGFVSLGLENLLIRIQNIFTSNTTYSFTSILTGHLAGITLGSLIASRWCDRKQVTFQAFFLLAIFMGLVGQLVLMYFGLVFIDNMWAQLFQGFLGALLFALIPGILFPLGVGLYLGKVNNIGIKTGRIYFFNTIGAVLGSLVIGFIIIPIFGIRNGGIILAIIPFLLLILFSLPQKKYYFVSLGILLLSVYTYYKIPKEFNAPLPDNAKLIFYEEGFSGTVTVTEANTSRGIYREMAIDGNAVSSNNPKMIIDAKLLAHLPLLLHPNPKIVSTLGFGTGGTSKSMLLHNVKTFALEIEEKIVEGSYLFSNMSKDVLDHQNFNLVLDDARSYLQATKQKFDVIVTDCTNLKYKSNPLLYTTDFFNIIKKRLLPGGITAAWVPLAGLSFLDLKILIASFQRINRNMTIWLYSRSITHFVVFIGTERPLKVDMEILGSRMRQKEIKEDLEAIGILDEYHLASMLLMRENDIKKMVRDSDVHTDENPILEFSDINQYLKPSVLNNLHALLKFQSDHNYEAFTESYQSSIRLSMLQFKLYLNRIISRDRDLPYLLDN